MRVGWIIDRGSWGNGRVGGAEMNAQQLIDDAPEGVHIIKGAPNEIPADVDCYVIHNCHQYTAQIIPMIKDKPIYKMIHDVWTTGDGALRQWLLNNATKTILVSPKLKEFMQWTINTPIAYVPSPVKFETHDVVKQKGAVWVGRLHAQKGVLEAIEWADKTNTPLDIYGFGELGYVRPPAVYKGELQPEQVQGVMAGYETFVFTPRSYDACPRVIFEAYKAGCRIVTNGWQGATWWIKNEPDAIDNASTRFWNEIEV